MHLLVLLCEKPNVFRVQVLTPLLRRAVILIRKLITPTWPQPRCCSAVPDVMLFCTKNESPISINNRLFPLDNRVSTVTRVIRYWQMAWVRFTLEELRIDVYWGYEKKANGWWLFRHPVLPILFLLLHFSGPLRSIPKRSLKSYVLLVKSVFMRQVKGVFVFITKQHAIPT
jgi:hypothetical protein